SSRPAFVWPSRTDIRSNLFNTIGNRIAATDLSGKLLSWSTGTDSRLGKINAYLGNDALETPIIWCKDGLHLFGVGIDIVLFADSRSGEVETVSRPEWQIYSAILSYDGRRLVVFGREHAAVYSRQFHALGFPWHTFRLPMLAN